MRSLEYNIDFFFKSIGRRRDIEEAHNHTFAPSCARPIKAYRYDNILG